MSSTNSTGSIFESDVFDSAGEIVGKLRVSLTGEHSADGVAGQLRKLADEIAKDGLDDAFPADYIAGDRTDPRSVAAAIHYLQESRAKPFDQRENPMSSTNSGDLLADLHEAAGVARRYLRISASAIEVADVPSEHPDPPADPARISEAERAVLDSCVARGHVDGVEVADRGARVTTNGVEYLTDLFGETPEHLIEVAAYAIVSSVLLRAEAGEVMQRAEVAIALATDPSALARSSAGG